MTLEGQARSSLVYVIMPDSPQRCIMLLPYGCINTIGKNVKLPCYQQGTSNPKFLATSKEVDQQELSTVWKVLATSEGPHNYEPTRPGLHMHVM